MEPIKSVEKLNKITRQKMINGQTQMKQMQPLNEIGGKSTEEIEGDNDLTIEIYKEPPKDTKDIWYKGFELVCRECQIKDIEGSCSKCGIYQYGDKFDVQLRRRQ